MKMIDQWAETLPMYLEAFSQQEVDFFQQRG